jgi:hypothetical protein
MTGTTSDVREQKMRSIFMQPGAAARAPKGRPRTTDTNTQSERLGRASDEASNATLKAKEKREGLPMVIDRAETRLPGRTGRKLDSKYEECPDNVRGLVTAKTEDSLTNAQ